MAVFAEMTQVTVILIEGTARLLQAWQQLHAHCRSAECIHVQQQDVYFIFEKGKIFRIFRMVLMPE
jgi:hypothetical protein